MPKISVIMPCFNAAEFIGTALQSVADQTVQPYEILVINDGSTDDSLNMIKASTLPIRLLTSSRIGGAGARNLGIRSAQGEWLAFLDADDLWHSNHLERAIEITQQFNPVGYINHYNHINQNNDTIYRKSKRIKQIVNGFGLDEYVQLFLRYRHFVGMSACIVRAKHAQAIGGLREDQTRRHDIEFWLRVVHKERWVFDPVASSAYRKARPGSLSTNSSDAAYDGFRAFFRHRDKAGNKKLYDLILRERARSAISHAFASQDRNKIQCACDMAFDSLSWRHKHLFSIAYRQPWTFPLLRSLKLI